MTLDYFFFYTEANIVCIVIFAILLRHERLYSTRQEKQIWFNRTMIAHILYFLSDIGWAAVISGNLPRTRALVILFNFLNFVLLSMISYGWFMYMAASEDMILGKTWKQRRLLCLPMMISTYYVLLMKSFFASTPKDLEEAGELDGLNKFGVFLRVVLPLSKPIIATMTLFYAVMYWNNWFQAFLYLRKEKWPVAYYLQNIIRGATQTDQDAQQVATNIRSCSMVLTALPIICVYPFIQKYYVQGMMLGGVKE